MKEFRVVEENVLLIVELEKIIDDLIVIILVEVKVKE